MSVPMPRRSLLLLPVVLAAIALPVAPAVADEGTSPVSTTSYSGGLPFIGLDLALLAAAGPLLGAAGYGMRRLTRAPGSA